MFRLMGTGEGPTCGDCLDKVTDLERKATVLRERDRGRGVDVASKDAVYIQLVLGAAKDAAARKPPEEQTLLSDYVSRPSPTERYSQFLASKSHRADPVGFDVDTSSPHLFDFQRDLVRWCIRRGRAALFASTGLGKTRMQVSVADHVVRHTKKPAIILAPLAVAAQTVAEAEHIGIGATLCRTDSDVRDGINVTNYDRLHLFDTDRFGMVVLDESSILKDFNSATRNTIIERFRSTPYKLACSATPAPNDFTELGNHAEFLGVMSRTEMLSQWFVHDGGSTQDWRLKGHAAKSFWRWVCSWAALVRSPEDLGYDGSLYRLPELVMHEHVIPADLAAARAMGKLFVEAARTLDEQRKARRASLSARVAEMADIVAREPEEPWFLWCELNDEADALEALIPGAVQIAGSDSPDTKEERLLAFLSGKTRVLVTKPSIAAHGLNVQMCARTGFVGVSHSFEQTFQAVRRFWRFGQTRPVHCHLVIGEAEGNVLANLRAKEKRAEEMANEMSLYTREFVRSAVTSAGRTFDEYNPKLAMKRPTWLRSAA
jgi:hypothetical protein